MKKEKLIRNFYYTDSVADFGDIKEFLDLKPTLTFRLGYFCVYQMTKKRIYEKKEEKNTTDKLT